MQEGITTRTRLAILIYSMINAVLFGIGLLIVLNVPALAAHSGLGIAAVVLLSLLLAAPIAWMIAPRLRARYARRDGGNDRVLSSSSAIPDRPA